MKYVVFIVNLTILFVIAYCEDVCSIDDKCDSQDNGKASKYLKNDEESYQKFVADLQREIKLTEESYQHCSARNCSCFFDRIDKDLSTYRDGITKEMINKIHQMGVKYQIINHKLYRQKECSFPARCSGIEHFLRLNLDKLDNTEMIINCRDWPYLSKDWNDIRGPVFSFSKTENYYDIMYPAWSFWEGGPAISTYPTGIGRWDKMRETIIQSIIKYPWKKKKSQGFFRGSRTTSERDSLVLLSRKFPKLVNAQYTKNQAWKSKKDTLGAEPVSDIPMEEHCPFKYLFNFRGVAASFRFRHLFMCQSLVINVGDEWKEFFYDALTPNYHFIQISADSSEDKLRYLLRFLQENDTLAMTIAKRGYDAISDMLTMKDINCYWHKLLVEYTKLLKFNVIRDNTLIEI